MVLVKEDVDVGWVRICGIALSGALLALGLTLAVTGARSQEDYPSRPIRLIAPFTAGGPADLLGRALSEGLRQRTGQTLVIENRPGANTLIGASGCKHAGPDGYAICMLTLTSMSLNPFLYSNLPYDPDKDFEPITNIAFTRQILILNKSVPANNFAELVQYSKQNPDKLNFASFGIGSESHLVVEWLKKQTGAKFTHVPFAGAAPGLIAFERGDVHLFYLVATPTIVEKVRSGAAKGILVPGDVRNPDLPDVPTYKDAGLPVLKTRNWFGLFAPGKTPSDRVKKLGSVFSETIKSAEFQQKYLNNVGAEGVGNSPAEFTTFLKEDRVRAGELVGSSGVHLKQ
jgi:tripartite-type tricarboxylate transporter receptor subunit TctC